MRILYIVHQFLPECATGTEVVTLGLAKAAQRAGHRVEVLTCSVGDAALWREVTPDGMRHSSVNGIPVHGLPAALVSDPHGFAPGTDAAARQIFDRFLDERPFDLVHVTHSLRMLDAVAAVRARQIPYLVTLTDFFLICHRFSLWRLNGARCSGPAGGTACEAHCVAGPATPEALARRKHVLRGILHEAREVVACSPFVADAFRREEPSLPLRVIGHGIDLLRFAPRAPRRKEEPLVFGMLGTISPEKGASVLARAFAEAKPAGARLELVGPWNGNPEVEREMHALAATSKAIHLAGPVPARDVPATLARFDVLCVPSVVPETFCLALHEGFATGLPALVSDLGNQAAVVGQAGCGRVIPAGDVSAWAEAIGSVAADPAQLESWRSRIPLPMRIEEETFLYGQLYQRCVARSAATPPGLARSAA
jgi:glycosyltransferase involved in cell wall biosynthesis